MTIRRSARCRLGQVRANRDVEARRRRAGVRRPPRLRAGRRSALPGLEPLRPAGAAGAAAVPGGRGPADRGAGRRQRVDGRRQPAQAGSGAADRRGAGVRRACQPGSRRASRRSASGQAPRALPPARGKARDPADPAFARRRRRRGRVRRWRAAVRAFLARRRAAAARAGDPDLRFLRPGRLPRGAGSAAPPPPGARRHPGQRARGDVARRCAATSSCATSRPARRAS